MNKNLVKTVENKGLISNLDELLIDRLANDYYKSLSKEIKINNIKVIDNDKYNLIYDEIYGAAVRLKVSNKLYHELNCTIKHGVKCILGFKKDIFEIAY